MEIIDTHLHVSPDTANGCDRVHDDLTMHSHQSGYMEPCVDVESCIALMSRENVSRGVLVQPNHLAYDHRYLSEAVRSHPETFSGIGCVNPVAQEAPRQLEALVLEARLSGVRLRPYMYRSYGLADARSFPLWAKSGELGTVICIYMAWTQAAGLERMLRQFPEVPVVIDHCGMPDLSPEKREMSVGAILRLSEYPNVYIKVSGPAIATRTDNAEDCASAFIAQLLGAFQASRLMWGSDYPNSAGNENYAEALNRFVAEDGDLGLTDAQRQWFLGGTARAVWGFA